MPLEGLRAWIGEVERKLGMRTRVFLVLSVIAIGGAGAAIYLAIDAREDSVSESDVQALQERLETQIGEAAAGTAPVTPEEPAESVEPAPQPEPEPESKGDGDGASGAGGASSPEGAGPNSGGASAPGNTGSTELKELVEQAKKQKAELEAETAGK
jgi:hypothetical protein